MKFLAISLIFLTGGALAGEAPALNIDQERVTVSGISAGAHMAHQLHIAYSDLFSGAGIVSGGPYNCADNSLLTAMNKCMMNNDDPLPVADISAGIRESAAAGKLADPANLADDRVWLFRGTEDSKISAEVHGAAEAVYAEFIPAEQIKSVDHVVAEHIFPAKGQGHGCTEMAAPFVGDCDYDAAGELLGFLYGDLAAPEPDAETPLTEVNLAGADDAELMETAYLFIPPNCAGGETSCALHLVLHGCAQSAETVGTGFIEQSGYLPWAAANDIVLAFPQVQKSMMAPLNPHACWDWWGYTDDDYANRDGQQMTVLVEWLKQL